MKILITLCIALFTGILSAQSPYESGMKKAFDLWSSQKPQEAVNLFERIAKAEKDNWIPYYSAAQVNIVTSFSMKDKKRIVALLEKAQEHLNEARSLSINNVEILVLEALLNTSKMITDPRTLGATLSPKIEGIYQKALAMAPDNPRVISSYAEWKMGGAKFFGKDPMQFCPDLKKALTLFKNEKESVPFYPNWGKDRTAMLVKKCDSK